MAGQVFLGVFLAGIALMIVYWLFTSFHWFTILVVGFVLWLTIYLLKAIIGFFTREKPTEEQKEKEIERNRIKNLSGFAKVYHYLVTVFSWVVGAVILFGIFVTIFNGFK